ncbi:hypothetical protein H0H93_015501, partial [Arthromyces matolae]
MLETTPLIRRLSSSHSRSNNGNGHRTPTPLKATTHIQNNIIRASVANFFKTMPHTAEIALHSIPAVLLGCLLNILDGISYGMIMFPGTGVFEELGAMGVSLFFLTAVLAQLVYTFGGSGFAGANGSMMIEVVPFFHILANDIAARIGESSPNEIIATTLAAFSLSSILTG